MISFEGAFTLFTLMKHSFRLRLCRTEFFHPRYSPLKKSYLRRKQCKKTNSLKFRMECDNILIHARRLSCCQCKLKNSTHFRSHSQLINNGLCLFFIWVMKRIRHSIWSSHALTTQIECIYHFQIVFHTISVSDTSRWLFISLFDIPLVCVTTKHISIYRIHRRDEETRCVRKMMTTAIEWYENI